MEVSLLNGLRVLGASLTCYYSIKLGMFGLEGFRGSCISNDPTSVSCSRTLDVEPFTLAAIKRTFSPWRGLDLIVVRRVAFLIHITP